MLKFTETAIRRGPNLLFSQANFALHAGWRIGITGRNGSGKSTLLALVNGEISPDSGQFEIPSQWTIAYVRQETIALDSTALDYVLDGDTEWRELDNALKKAEESHDGERIAMLHDRLAAIDGYSAPARAARLLHGLGFAPADATRPVRDFSGGWRMRLNLATALMCRSDLLMLDEPTNHLDLDAVLWLETWLRSYQGTLLLISHDRDFLDAIVTHVVSIDQGRVELFAGNVSGFERKRAERLSQQKSQLEKQQRERAHLESFIERFRAKATKARQAQSRMKALERMTDLAPIRAASTIQFEFRKPAHLPNPLLTLDRVSAGYNDRRILNEIKFRLAPGDRIALLGANGAGKSTLIKVLAGALQPNTGERLEAKELRVGYFAQQQLEQLDPEATAVQHLKRLDPAISEQAARDILGGFGLAGERALVATAPFSGGEKARLCLALTVYQKPNLLLLDEPTNHLDLEMREALTEALQEFEGAMVLVAHDRALIRACCDNLLLVHNGQLTEYDGDLEDYARFVVSSKQDNTANNASSGASTSRRDDRRERAQQRNRLAPLRKEIDKLEKKIALVTDDLRKIDAALTDPSLYEKLQDPRLADLLQQQQTLRADLADAEHGWVETHTEMERIGENG